MISSVTETRFPTKRVSDFHTPDRWWISPRIIQPFQQTALYVQKYGNELSQEEYEIINAVLPADEIAELYVANRADAVKFRYKQLATGEDPVNYFSLWLKQFFKHSHVYFEAFF